MIQERLETPLQAALDTFRGSTLHDRKLLLWIGGSRSSHVGTMTV